MSDILVEHRAGRRGSLDVSLFDFEFSRSLSVLIARASGFLQEIRWLFGKASRGSPAVLCSQLAAMPLPVVVIAFFCLAATVFVWQRSRRSLPLPPGPTGLPLLGHLYVVPSDRPEVRSHAQDFKTWLIRKCLGVL